MYFYHAEALGLGGQISSPLNTVLESQAATSLPMSGGRGKARVEQYSLPQIVSCGAAYTEVTGSYNAASSTYTTQVDTTVEKLDIMGVVTADRVAASIVSTHVITNNRDEASIVPVACSFDNLRIAGQLANPQVDCDCFGQYGTFNDFQKAYQGPQKAALRKRIMWDQLHAGCPAPLDEMYKWHQSHQDLPNIAICSLVKDLGLKSTSGTTVYGPIVVVPNFGIIYVCEFVLIHRQRRLNMLRVTLGSGSPGKFQGEKWTSQTASTAPITSVPPVSGGSTSPSLGSVDGELSIASLSSNGSLFPP